MIVLLFSPVRTLEEAQQFIRKMVLELGAGFHPDNEMSDYVNMKSGVPTYNPMEALIRQQLLDSCNDQFRKADVCIYGFTIDLLKELHQITNN